VDAALTKNRVKSTHGGKRAGAGRRKGAVTKATYDIRMLARQYCPEALIELARLARKSTSDNARVAAIKELLDRGYGKSPQPLTGEDGSGPIIVEIVRFGG
jgi:hypothetical protein